jgi:hypothetical protein
MLDLQQWLERAASFVSRCRNLPGEAGAEIEVGPPMSEADVEALAGQLPRGLPAPMRRFLLEGSANCSCRYWWETADSLTEIFPYEYSIGGGPRLCIATELMEDQESVALWGASHAEAVLSCLK